MEKVKKTVTAKKLATPKKRLLKDMQESFLEMKKIEAGQLKGTSAWETAYELLSGR